MILDHISNEQQGSEGGYVLWLKRVALPVLLCKIRYISINSRQQLNNRIFSHSSASFPFFLPYSFCFIIVATMTPSNEIF